MSDRYRPPTGPRNSSKKYDDRKNGSKPSYKSSYSMRDSSSRDRYPPTGPKRYTERDTYRSGSSQNDAYQSGARNRPSGPSGYRPSNSEGRNYTNTNNVSRDHNGKSIGQGGTKRLFPSEPKGFANDKKRRDLGGPSSVPTTAPSTGYKDNGGGYRNARYDSKQKVNFNKFPKGPKSLGGPVDKNRFSGGDFKRQVTPSAIQLKKSQIYSVKVSKPFEIYERVQQVGEGTYGKVYKAKNCITEEFVALKKLRLESEREGFPITAMREIKLLQSFDHENVVGLLEMMIEHNQIYMVLDYMDHDLTGLLTHPDLKLEESHKKFIFKQLMEGLNYLHKRRVIHRDIKGSNILLDNMGRVKIADFGLARTMKIVNDHISPDYTNRVITIWYRPPELLLGSTNYGREVDIWGVGCLLIELYSKVAAFQGFEEVGQLHKIFNIMGTPTVESWPEIEDLPWIEMLKPKINKASNFRNQYASIMSEQSFDLAEKLLQLNPAKRLTAEEALQHAYFTDQPAPEPLLFLKDIKGEWHEFETKKRRRKERKRLQEEKTNQQSLAQLVPQTQPSAPPSQQMITPSQTLASPSQAVNGISDTPLGVPE
ncbi:uncharacterized protein PRCAT00005416001 [Priceomyces carsonii]|uniref:uncharacterized protein n=1 Tax=Priceomyces carsonii TaxID=28549 RepID=UPI002ED8F8F0|nr:unnamed protein product [Priceomyces carsonii]